MDNYYEETIDLKNLFFYILKKWKHILIGLLVGLLLGCAFSFYKMSTNNPNAILDRVNSDTFDKSNVIQYSDYVSLYNKEVDYAQNSLLMNLDSNNMYTGNLSYSVNSLEKDIKSIENYYDGILNVDNNFDTILSSLGNEYKDKDVKELINLDFLLSNNNSVNISSSVYDSGLLDIIIYGTDEKLVETLKNKIEEIIDEANNYVRYNYEAVTISKVKDSVVYGYNSTVSQYQINKINSRQSILNNLTNLKSKLSSDELFYHEYYIAGDGSGENAQASFSKKWPVLFGIGLAVVVAGVYFLLYLFDDHIKSFDEIKDRYKLPLLGTLKVTDKEYKNVIDKFINGLDKKDYNNLDYIKSSIKLLDNKSIMLCNEYDELNKEFDKLDSRIDVLGTLNNDTKSLEKLKKADGVILVSKLWESRNSDIQRQIDIVNNAGKKVVGVIGLD